MRFIDKLPYSALLIMTVLMLGAPFVPEPHLVEKMRMLMDGTLAKPLDMFDVVWHLLPATLLIVKLVKSRKAS
ncbi:MAG: RND transporter [Hydrogenophilales bacterium CG17_big_fil_post_rev_8_21_14_2_50_63_12]|nr:MAG: RND transporter [Hydrogenophilales bacterium CG17_big_fil_post_rev_8_21_14_2_50_63_12]PIX95529.1 MAG: RND transporter [Hydrogenophilales bacterium CG_4_10_14_3_um_filter_63_21]PJB05415.1 MAG: RND transporter [Hydrogenophilales bacterium CG_4_9_14_3_um_filter_63_34]